MAPMPGPDWPHDHTVSLHQSPCREPPPADGGSAAHRGAPATEAVRRRRAGEVTAMGYLNPLLRLPAAQGLQALGAPERAALARLLMDLRAQANDEAENAWRRRKGPMACYWRAVATYARHIAHVLRMPRRPRRSHGADATMALPKIHAAAMTAQDIVAVFEDLSVRNRNPPLDEAVVGLARWMSQRRTRLTDEDFTALAAVGGAIYEAALQHRMAAGSFPSIR
ncbi:MAG: hypothetical protein ACO1OY_01185 [Ramlibacter sp.]